MRQVDAMSVAIGDQQLSLVFYNLLQAVGVLSTASWGLSSGGFVIELE